MQRVRYFWQSIIGISILGMILAACSGGAATVSVSDSSSASTTSSTTSSTTTTTAAATPTTAPSVAHCSDIAAFAGAGAIGLSTSTFLPVPFPSGTVGYVSDNYETNGYQYRIINYCTPGNTVAGIRSYFTTAFTTNGYANTAIFPLHGNPNSMCGDPYCWVHQEAGPPFYAG